MTTLDPTVDVATTVRQERLAVQVSGLRGRRGLSSDRWMLVVGGTLLPLGVMLVLLGWWGASHTVFVFEQVPYLLSGGVLGLALVIAGGFLYFAYWLTLMVRESRLGRAELADALGRVERLLEEAGAAPRTARSKGAPSSRLVATRTGTMVHRPDCVAVDGKADLREVDAETAGLTPCKLCDPFG
ncbi:MAG TPA: hypothetical protein VM097_04700 [Mycobacteriales bacterium]|nr:hypothetical protein [Mycobacteriales bacterium]